MLSWEFLPVGNGMCFFTNTAVPSIVRSLWCFIYTLHIVLILQRFYQRKKSLNKTKIYFIQVFIVKL